MDHSRFIPADSNPLLTFSDINVATFVTINRNYTALCLFYSVLQCNLNLELVEFTQPACGRFGKP